MMFMLSAEEYQRLKGKDSELRKYWKLTHETRKRCSYCSSRVKTIYQCSKCSNGVCISHSELICGHCKENK